MTRAEVLSVVKTMEAELKVLGFGKLYLFGSVGRGEPNGRDVDLLYVRHDKRLPGFYELTDAIDRLEQVLGRPVDLVDSELLHQRIRPRVDAEKIEIF
jgi:predicted nucleotidyltransferase